MPGPRGPIPGSSGAATMPEPATWRITGDALATLLDWHRVGGIYQFDLIVTDPPYAYSGENAEHAMTATVALVLREAARLLRTGGWMLVMSAASWRSHAYIVEALRGVLIPVRIATWCKPAARTVTRTPGWAWASVNVIAFRAGKAHQPGAKTKSWPSGQGAESGPSASAASSRGTLQESVIHKLGGIA